MWNSQLESSSFLFMVWKLLTISDPQVETMYDVTLQVGDKWTFEVEYQSFEGSAKISVTTPTERRSMSGRSRYGRLRFTIESATTEHTGIYTVEVFDERRRKSFSQNPAKTTFEVTVKKNQCDCSLL